MADEVNELSLLLIEDNEGDADLFREYLADYPDQHFDISHATSLLQALDRLASKPIDLIVSDLILPDSSGISTIERIHDAAPRVPVVVLSGIADDELGGRAIQAGAQDFLHKNALDSNSLARSLRYASERGRLQSQFRSLVESNADAIVVVNHDGMVRYINKAAEALYGRRKEALIGQSFGSTITGDTITEIELTLPGGKSRAAEMRAAPIDWEGEAAWLASIRDVTDRKRAEELQRRLYHADRLASIGQLASGVAHEVNNPATFIQGNLETLQEHLEVLQKILGELESETSGAVSGPARELVSRLSQHYQLGSVLDEMGEMLSDNLIGIERITKIVKALSSFARIERDEIEPVDINEIIDVACSMTYNEIRHRAMLSKELGPVPLIAGDRGKLAQVFTNLLINAAHAIAPGAADRNRIRVITTAADARVLVRIEDTGCGIPEKNLERIFKPFFTTKPRGQGTGLGLPLSADIVQKHEGKISATSTVGEGTCFEIALPIKPDEVIKASRTVGPDPLSAGPINRARVLVIDDEHMLLEALYRMLRRSHEVVMAEGGMAGISTLEQNAAFDVLICDLMMPEVDGIQFYKIVRQRWPDLTPRIVFCSGGAFTDHAKDFIGMVSDDNIVIEKPIKRVMLLDAVSTIIEKHGPLGHHLQS